MYEKSKRKAYAAVDIALAAALEKVTAGLATYPLLDDDDDLIRQVIRDAPIHGFLPMSNFRIRRAASVVLIEEVMAHWAPIARDNDVRHFLFTGCFNDGITFEDAPIIPLTRIKRKVARALRSLELAATCAVECDVLSKRLPGERARRLLVHVHGICWTFDPSFRPRAAETALTRGWAFRNSLGLPPIRFTSRAESARRWPGFVRKQPERDQIASSMAWLGYYLLKAPHYAKNRIVSETRIYARPDAGAFRHKTALRFAEIFSQMQPSDIVFGVGEGTEVSDRFAARMRELERDSRSEAPALYFRDVPALWGRYFAAHPRLRFVPSRII